jgi:hypothetical protein
VKITVIATGFDRVATPGRLPQATTLQTPVDLHVYTEHFARGAALQPISESLVAPDPVVDAPPRRPAAPSLAVNRRPGLELSLPVLAGGEDGEPLSPLDVPAFLRRQS